MAINIIMTRVDDRLIHGQGMAWIKSLPINLVLIANDEVSESEFEQDLMYALIPSSVQSRFFSIQKVIDVIQKASDSQKIFMIVKSLKDVKRLIDGGVPIKDLNIGNIRRGKGTEKISAYINLNDEDKEIIRGFLAIKDLKISTKQTPMGGARGEHVNWKSVLK